MSDELVEKAAELAAWANDTDPGMAAARLSLNAKTATKQRAIAMHWRAVGVREALHALGLAHAASTSTGATT